MRRAFAHLDSFPVGIEQPRETAEKPDLSEVVYAQAYASLLTDYPELIAVLCHWPNLSREARARIVALVMRLG